MKYTAFLLLIFFCISCSSKKSYKQTVLTPKNLPAQLFEIDPAIENTIRTNKGATVSFPANAFKLNGTGKVKVEVKEAYSMKDILLAGLVTESNGKPLSSGGMIYINAQQNNKDIELQKTANVATPTPYVNPDMQLYKGEYNADSTINWVAPKPLDSTPKNSPDGKAMFLTNCASCHSIDKPSTGPELYNILKRAPSKEWLYRFTRNWENAFFHKDSTGLNYYAYTCCAAGYNPTQYMPKYPLLTDAEFDALYAYIQYESDAKPIANYKSYSDTCTPCLTDTGMIAVSYWDTSVINNNTKWSIPAGNIATTPADPTEIEKSFRTGGFTDPLSTGIYNFTIETMGWYNIDLEVAGLPGTEYCSVSVKLNEEQSNDRLMMYLVIPSKKNLSVSNKQDGDTWSFNKVDGKVPIHLNDQAYIIAFGEKGDNMIYGIRPFITKKENLLEVSISTVSQARFLEHIGKLGLDGLNFSVEKNAPVPGRSMPGNEQVPKNSIPPDPSKKYNYPVDSLPGNCPCKNEQPVTAAAPKNNLK